MLQTRYRGTDRGLLEYPRAIGTAGLTPTAVLAVVTSLAMLGCQPPAVGADQDAPAAEDDNPHLWKPRTKSVAVFKNGLGFFIREGEVRVRDDWTSRAADPDPAGTGPTSRTWGCSTSERCQD